MIIPRPGPFQLDTDTDTDRQADKQTHRLPEMKIHCQQTYGNEQERCFLYEIRVQRERESERGLVGSPDRRGLTIIFVDGIGLKNWSWCPDNSDADDNQE